MVTDLIRVLLVEEDAGDRRLVEQLLDTCSQPVVFDVESVGSLSAAVELLANTKYDILLLFMRYADAAGLETVRNVSEAHPSLPIVVLKRTNTGQIGSLVIASNVTSDLVKEQPLKDLLVRRILYALEREKEKKLIFDSNLRLQETSQELFITKQALEKTIRDLSKTNERLEGEVSLRKKVEQSLQASETNLRKVILTSPDGIIVIGNDGIVLFVNPAAESLFDRKAEELLGELFGFPLMKDTAIEVDIVRHGNESGIAEMQAAETEWDGQSAYLVLLHDITERKRAKEQLVHAAREWRTTFDSITDMISIHDKNCRITRVNMALADALKKDPKELIGKICYEVFHGTQQPCPNCPHLQSLKSKEPATLELFEPSLDIHLEISTSPILDENGEVTRSVHIAKDITERSQAKEILEKSNKQLAEYNQLKDEFVSTASHELCTPLSIIMGAIRLILDEIPGRIVEEQRKVLATAMKNVERLGRIVDSLLNISKIESGKLDLHKTVVNICELIKDTVSNYESLSQEKGIHIDHEVPQTNVDICLDQDKTREVLMNLISNSFKFTPEGGWIKVICAKQEGRVLVTVRDSGVGIAKEDIPKLFDKFTQFSRKAGPGEKGTGLGLAIVKKLVEMHGGTIEVESKVGQGTTFTISLPLTAEAKAESLSAETDELVEETVSSS